LEDVPARVEQEEICEKGFQFRQLFRFQLLDEAVCEFAQFVLDL
jgi:hypothetical protein